MEAVQYRALAPEGQPKGDRGKSTIVGLRAARSSRVLPPIHVIQRRSPVAKRRTDPVSSCGGRTFTWHSPASFGLGVRLRDESDRESAKYKTDLGSTRIRRSSEILSEGEQRALALAAFLTEVSVSTPGAPIIIDDPVSSLDHERLVNVAERLVQEAEHRQVIVFTHSLEFLYDLENHVEKVDSPFMVRTIFRTDDSRTGLLNPSPLPWKGQKVKNRINVLRDSLTKIKKMRNEAPDEYEVGTRHIYTLLRETYERFVEEVLFHNVVRRYSPDVRTNELRYVTVPDAIAERFHKGYDKSCDYSHDNPRGSPVAPPDPEEIEQDIDEFMALIEDTRKAQSNTEKNRPSMKP